MVALTDKKPNSKPSRNNSDSNRNKDAIFGVNMCTMPGINTKAMMYK